jgi:hypothetical protein
MDRSDIVTKIEAATRVIRDAEESLQRLVADGTVARADEDADVEKVVRAATSRLRLAEAKLVDLERLLPLAKIDSGKTVVDAAKSVVKAAEQELIRVLDQMVVAEPLQET